MIYHDMVLSRKQYVILQYVMKCYQISSYVMKCYHPDVIKCHEKSFNLPGLHLMTCHNAVNLIQRGISENLPFKESTDHGLRQ